MVLGIISKFFVKTAPKILSTTKTVSRPREVITVQRPLPKPAQQSKVIGSFAQKPIISVGIPRSTAIKPTQTSGFSIRSILGTTQKSTPRTSTIRSILETPTTTRIISNKSNFLSSGSISGVQDTASRGINLSLFKSQPNIFKSPIIQETGEGVTFLRRRPVQARTGFGRTLFGQHNVPIRPDNAFLIRPNNPKDLGLLNQFRQIQTTQVSRLSRGTTNLESIPIGDVRNLIVGGRTLKDVATVSTAKGKILQKGDIIFRRVGSNPKDEFVFGGVGDTFRINKNIKNSKPFDLRSASELGVQDTASRGGSILNLPQTKLTKLELATLQNQSVEATGQKLTPVAISSLEKMKARGVTSISIEADGQIIGRFPSNIGKGSELGVQDLRASGRNILDSDKTFSAFDSVRSQKGFGNFTPKEQQGFLKFISDNPSGENVNFINKLVLTRDPDPLTRGFFSKVMLTPAESLANTRKFAQVKQGQAVDFERGVLLGNRITTPKKIETQSIKNLNPTQVAESNTIFNKTFNSLDSGSQNDLLAGALLGRQLNPNTIKNFNRQGEILNIQQKINVLSGTGHKKGVTSFVPASQRIGQGSELGVQDTARRGGNLLVDLTKPRRTISNTIGSTQFDNSISAKGFRNLIEIPNLKQNTIIRASRLRKQTQTNRNTLGAGDTRNTRGFQNLFNFQTAELSAQPTIAKVSLGRSLVDDPVENLLNFGGSPRLEKSIVTGLKEKEATVKFLKGVVNSKEKGLGRNKTFQPEFSQQELTSTFGINQQSISTNVSFLRRRQGIQIEQGRRGVTPTQASQILDDLPIDFKLASAPRIARPAELGVQETASKGFNLANIERVSLGRGQGDTLVKETPDIGFNSLRNVFDNDLTDIGRGRLVKISTGADRETTKVFSKNIFDDVLDDIDSPRNFILGSGDEINRLTPPKNIFFGNALKDPNARILAKDPSFAGSGEPLFKILRTQPTAIQTKKIAKDLNNPIIFDDATSIVGKTNLDIFGERLPFGILGSFKTPKKTFAKGFDDLFSDPKRSRKLRENRDSLNFGDFEDLF